MNYEWRCRPKWQENKGILKNNQQIPNEGEGLHSTPYPFTTIGSPLAYTLQVEIKEAVRGNATSQWQINITSLYIVVTDYDHFLIVVVYVCTRLIYFTLFTIRNKRIDTKQSETKRSNAKWIKDDCEHDAPLLYTMDSLALN